MFKEHDMQTLKAEKGGGPKGGRRASEAQPNGPLHEEAQAFRQITSGQPLPTRPKACYQAT